MKRHSSLHRQVAQLLAALLLAGAPACQALAADDKPLTAILLVAGAEVADSDFADSVVLVMNDLGPEPAGIIINKPTPLAVAQLFPDLKRLAQLHDKVYFGGPVGLDSVWFLFRAAAPAEHAVRVCDGVYLSASRDLLLRLLGRDKPMAGLRIFLGHAGWGPGQLESEIANRDWTLQQAAPDAIFGGKSEHPWHATPAPKHGA